MTYYQSPVLKVISNGINDATVDSDVCIGRLTIDRTDANMSREVHGVCSRNTKKHQETPTSILLLARKEFDT
jgi:hypothetical protein